MSRLRNKSTSPYLINEVELRKTSIAELSRLPKIQLFCYATLNNVNVPSDLRIYDDVLKFVQLILTPKTDQSYKTLVESCSVIVVRLLLVKHMILKEYDLDFFSDTELRLLLLNDNHLDNFNSSHSSKAQTITIRSNRYINLSTSRHVKLICRLYDIKQDVKLLKTVTHQPPHPLEPYILKLGVGNAESISRTLGMAKIIDEPYNVYQYVENNILEYRNVAIRVENLSVFTPKPLEDIVALSDKAIYDHLSFLYDSEFFTLVGAFFPYNSRQDLIDKTVHQLFNPSFFVPFVRKANNTHTTYLLNSVFDVEIPIAYGTFLNYHIYELDDFIEAWRPDSITGLTKLIHPEERKKRFTISEVYTLLSLVKLSYHGSNKGDKGEQLTVLEQCIAFGINDIYNREKTIASLGQQYALLNGFEGCALLEIFQEIMNCGLYMRSWKGPNYPKPFQHAPLDKGAEYRTAQSIGRIISLKKQTSTRVWDLLMSLPIVEYDKQGKIIFNEDSFETCWCDVELGKSCIRQNSSKFIGTSAEYTQIFYNIDILKFDKRLITILLE